MTNQCKICYREGEAGCEKCLKGLCSYCKDTHRCLLGCSECAGDSLSTPAFILQRVCKGCFGPQPAEIAVFWDYSDLGNLTIAERSKRLSRLLGQNPTLHYFAEAPYKEQTVSGRVLKILNRKMSEKLSHYRRFIVVTSRPLEIVIPSLLELFIESNATCEVLSPQFERHWLLRLQPQPVPPLEMVISFLRLHAASGMAACADWYIKDSITTIHNLTEVLQEGVDSGLLNRRNFQVSNCKCQVYSLTLRKLDSESLWWAVFALERLKLMPYLWKIVQVLKSVYNLTVSYTDLLNWVSSNAEQLRVEYKEHGITVSSLRGVYSERDDQTTEAYLSTLLRKTAAQTHTQIPMLLNNYEREWAAGFVSDYWNLSKLKRQVEMLRNLFPLLSYNALKGELNWSLRIDWDAMGFESIDKLLETLQIHPSDGECQVCFETLYPSYTTLKCGHVIHPGCLKDYLTHPKTVAIACITCKRPLDEDEKVPGDSRNRKKEEESGDDSSIRQEHSTLSTFQTVPVLHTPDSHFSRNPP